MSGTALAADAQQLLKEKACLSCHTLYAVGGKVGPEITGANRGSIDYLLENILDPSAVIPKEYAATRFVLTDDRTVTGIVKGEVNGVLTVMTDRETLTIAAKDIASRNRLMVPIRRVACR